MPELLEILKIKNERDFEDKKFFASLQGAQLDGGQDSEGASMEKWEQIKARAFSKGKTSDPNDILALQGKAAERAGFGIGMGLDYEVIK